MFRKPKSKDTKCVVCGGVVCLCTVPFENLNLNSSFPIDPLLVRVEQRNEGEMAVALG